MSGHPDGRDLEVRDPEVRDPEVRDPDGRDPDLRDPDLRDPDLRDPDLRDPDLRHPDGRDLEVRWVAADDPVLGPLVADLARDYDARYEPNDGVPSSAELTRYPPEDFAAVRGGAFLALLEDGRLVAGGALKRGRPNGAGASLGELKRMWTAPGQRRRGFAGRVLAELEQRAVQLGYRGLELSTGARQPEAVALYLRHGWTPAFDLDGDWEAVGYLRFTKPLPPGPPRPP